MKISTLYAINSCLDITGRILTIQWLRNNSKDIFNLKKKKITFKTLTTFYEVQYMFLAE